MDLSLVRGERSLFRVRVHPEYVHVVDDIVRLVIIQCVIQSMFYLNDPSAFPFLSPIFVATLLYIIVGVALYWLVLRKVLLFV